MAATPPPLPELLAQWRERTDAALAASTRDLVQQYAATWEVIQRDLDDVLARIKQAQDDGEPVSPAWLQRQAQLEVLRRSVALQMTAWAKVMEDRLGQSLPAAAAEGIQYGQEVGAAAVADQLPAGVTGQWAGLSSAAAEAIAVAAYSPDSPLTDLLYAMGPQVWDKIAGELFAGVALGRNPRDVARRIHRDVEGVTLRRSLLIARTEQLRAQRAGTAATFAANADVLEGWTWLSAADERTCAACWAMHGTVHPVADELDGHPQCRCQPVPLTKTTDELLAGAGIEPLGGPDTRLELPEGADLFARLDPDTRLAILGPTRLGMLNRGEVTMADMVTRTTDPRWGSMRRAATISELRDRGGTLPPKPVPKPKPKPPTKPTGGRKPKPPTKPKPAPPTDVPAAVDTPPAAPQPRAVAGGKAKPGPTGTPVSGALMIGPSKQSRVGKGARAAMAAIDKVHGDGDLRPLPMVQNNSRNAMGAYRYRVGRDGQGLGGDPVDMRVSAAFTRGHAFTVAHEVGHWLDHQVIGPRNRWGSRDAAAGDGTPAQSALHAAIQQSAAVGYLRTMSLSRDSRAYLLDDRELFARAYSQYVAERSGDPDLLAGLEDTRGGPIPYQWSEADFAPIASAMDDLMVELGWMTR